MKISITKSIAGKSHYSLFPARPIPPIGVLSQQDLKRIVAEIIG